MFPKIFHLPPKFLIRKAMFFNKQTFPNCYSIITTIYVFALYYRRRREFRVHFNVHSDFTEFTWPITYPLVAHGVWCQQIIACNLFKLLHSHSVLFTSKPLSPYSCAYISTAYDRLKPHKYSILYFLIKKIEKMSPQFMENIVHRPISINYIRQAD